MSPLLLLILIYGEGVQPVPDPECYMTLPEIAKLYGYPSEVHIVRTEDDYLLELHRIPHGKNVNLKANKGIVFLQHGLLADGNNFLSNLANESAATIFADAGFDVWISNSRGSPPSQKHIGYGPENPRFWNFSWQEMSAYDLTASIDYVLQKTGQDSLYYIGHSQGTVIMFDRLSDDPDFAKKIRQFHALAPVATVSHIGGLFHYLGNKLYWLVDFILQRIPNYPLQIPKFVQKILAQLCSVTHLQNICTMDIGFVDGKEKLFNMSRVGTYMCHFPASTSMKDLEHWVQLASAKRFQKFDYKDKNMAVYGQPTPPVFNLSRITAPTYLYWSKDDVLADTDDIRETILVAMKGSIKGNLELPHYTHLDFVYGLDAAREVYGPIINTIKEDMDHRRSQKQMLRDNRIY